MKKGLFVGSFNPITKAHMKISKNLIFKNYLDYIYYLPVNSNKKDLISINERINLINLVKKENEEVLNIYDYSIDGLFNYNILIKIKNITHLIMGSDLFLKFKTFKNYQAILKKYYLIVINRQFNIDEYIKNNYQEYLDKIIVINNQYNGSSSICREELKKDRQRVRYLDKKVLDYIKKNNLYN